MPIFWAQPQTVQVYCLLHSKIQYEEALEIIRDLAKKNPDVYLPYVATTLNNLGVLSRDNNEMEQAKIQYEEALEIRRGLSKKNPYVYLPDVAMTLSNLGNLSRTNNEMKRAKIEYEEAVELRRGIS